MTFHSLYFLSQVYVLGIILSKASFIPSFVGLLIKSFAFGHFPLLIKYGLSW